MDVQQMAKKARASISRYCMEECKAYCCRKGYLVMSLKEAELVTQNQISLLEAKGVLKKIRDEEYSFDLNNQGSYCPSLVDFKCVIHRNKNRPSACKEFPLFIQGDLVKLSPRCPAVKEGLFYPYVIKFLKKGYKICKSHPYADLDFNHINV